MSTDSELRDAAERVRRVESGERGKFVYGFDDEEMDDFMYRMLENAMTRDLKLLAKAYLAQRADDGMLGQCPACKDGILGADHYGEAIDCHYCGGSGLINSGQYIHDIDRLHEVVGDLQAADFELSELRKARADDGELIDAAFLESLGFIKCCTSRANPALDVQGFEDWTITFDSGDGVDLRIYNDRELTTDCWINNAGLAAGPQTRGQLRQLLSALGVQSGGDEG